MDSPMCYVVGAKELTIKAGDNPAHWQWKASADSRFPEVVELISIRQLKISVKIESHNLFSYTPYAAYLVYKLAARCCGLDSVNAVVKPGSSDKMRRVVHLNGRDPVRRTDGWMEIEMGADFYNHEQINGVVMVGAKLTEMDGETWKKGLIIECIEFRPTP